MKRANMILSGPIPRVSLVVVTGLILVMAFARNQSIQAQGSTSDAVPQITLGKINVIDLPQGATPEEQAAIHEAVKDVNKVMASAEFKRAVLQMDAWGQKGYSGQQVYDLVVKNTPITIDVTIFEGDHAQNHQSRTEGYEDESSPKTCFTNRYFLTGYGNNPGYLASLMLHESMHVLGFKHHGPGWMRAKYVPYRMNYIYDDVAKLLKLPTSDDVLFSQDKAIATENTK
jgi:hypothetical protein